jgi:hypothetical protein
MTLVGSFLSLSRFTRLFGGFGESGRFAMVMGLTWGNDGRRVGVTNDDGHREGEDVDDETR